MKYIETPVVNPFVGTELDGLVAFDTTPIRSPRYTWNWDGGSRVSIFDAGNLIATFPATHQSRDGLRVVDALDSCVGDGRVQVSDHGAGRVSVQVFDEPSRLILDIVTAV